MNGVHDLGGMHGFGPVQREEDEPVFHADWEKVVFGISQVVRAQALYNVDEFRRAIERMAPADYLAASYYERWLASIESNLIEKGILTREEVDQRTAFFSENPGSELPQGEASDLLSRVLRPTAGTLPDGDAPTPRYAVGDRVVARNVHPRGHTRLPRYVRGKRGVVEAVRGIQTFPDTNAHGLGRQPQPVYSVRFAASELWGESAEPRESLFIDLWESYLVRE